MAQYAVFSTFDLKSAYHQIPITESDRPFTAFEACGRLYQFTRIPFGVTNGVAAFQRSMNDFIDKNQLNGTFAYLDNITVCGIDQADHDRNVQCFLDKIKGYSLTLNEDKTIASVTEIRMLGYLISNKNIRPDPERMQPLINLPIPTDQTSLKRALGLFSYYSQWVPKYSDALRPLCSNPSFPLGASAVAAFERIKAAIVP